MNRALQMRFSWTQRHRHVFHYDDSLENPGSTRLILNAAAGEIDQTTVGTDNARHKGRRYIRTSFEV
jgi:hypothetical protein